MPPLRKKKKKILLRAYLRRMILTLDGALLMMVEAF